MPNSFLYYSVIIPHHNSPDLLNRCLNSIPQRDDIEIIVIDDNSDEDKKPKLSRPDVKLISIDAEHTKGAGRARNYGLKEATGKWIVFADADDFFVPSFIDVLNQYKDQELDVVYYDAQAANTINLTPMPNLLKRQNGFFNAYDGSKYSTDVIKYRLHSPWWKMVRREFIEKHQIQFEEVPKGNDVFFSYQVGYFAKNIAIEKCQLYVYTYNPCGITNGKKNKQIYLSTLRNMFKRDEFYKFINHSEWIKNSMLRFWLKIIKSNGIKVFLSTLYEYIKQYPSMLSTRLQYVDSIKSRIKP